MDQSVTLTMLPVCECGQVISDLACGIIDKDIFNGFKYQHAFFQPMYCPNCGRYITNLEIKNRYLKLFKEES